MKCDRCQNVIEGKPYTLMQLIGGRCVQDAPSCFIYDLCESCARAAKQWISESPRVPLSTGPTLSDSLDPLTGKEPSRSGPDRPSSLPPLEGFQDRNYD